MSSIVTLTTVWINLAGDPTVSVSFSNMATLTVTKTIQGEIRRYANGRTRAVTRAGVTDSAEVNLPYCDRTQITWLEDNIGQLVCVRDNYGRKFFGIYLTVPVQEIRHTPNYGNVTLSLGEVYFTEAV